MSAIKNDGSVNYGSRIATLSVGSTPTPVAFVAENFKVTRSTKEITRLNEIGEPNGRLTIAEFVKGSATLLIPTSTTNEPGLGLEFTETVDSVIGSETFYIDSVDREESNTDQRKLNITFTKKLS